MHTQQSAGLDTKLGAADFDRPARAGAAASVLSQKSLSAEAPG